MQHKHLLLTVLILLGSSLPAEAATTNYTVKAGGGGNFTTIAACSAQAVAGNTCTVFAGTYSGWTQSASGSAGLPITFTANPGDTVTITSGVNISSQSFITISHFTFSSGGVTGNGTSSHNIIDSNSFTTTAFRINDGQGTGGSDNVVSNNTIAVNSTGNVVGIYLFGDRNRIENNKLSSTDGDCMDLGGANVVVRGNYCHDVDGAASGQHIDFIQIIGGGNPTLSHSLIEGNVERNCTNDGGNCHFFIIRTTGVGIADGVIVRFNYAQNLDSSGPVNIGGVGDNVPNAWFYNNTIAPEKLYSGNGSCVSWQNAPAGAAFNNICYNAAAGNSNFSPFYDFSGGGLIDNGNLIYTTGYAGSWGNPFGSEITYALLHNLNPLFANYPTDSTLLPLSPAINAGASLTSVAAGDTGSGTSLVVNNVNGLQPGWAGTQGDWIRVGPTTTVQIVAINYATNTLTLASSISRSAGNPVYLYKDSNGNVVLNGAKPDIGASQSGAKIRPPAPTNLQDVVH
jgi:hypothetical protein